MDPALLIKIAKTAIADILNHSKSLNPEFLLQQEPALAQQQATFVTLTLNGQLRGCIGSILPHRPLLDDLISNARSAAFGDPRFLPVSSEEFEDIRVEVSILTTPQRFEYDSIKMLKDRVTHQDGVILKSGTTHQATFLPQVWEELPTFELFFSHLCQKANLDDSCLKTHPEIYLYQVEKYQE